MFQTEVVEDNQNIYFTINFFPRKSCSFLDDVEKYGTNRQATDKNIIRLMRFQTV